MSRKNHKDKAKDNEKIKAEEQKLEAAEAAGQAEVVEQTEEGPNEAEVYETSEDILLEAGRDESLKPRRSIPDTVRMGGSLLIICAVVALVVSFVNAITVDIIAEAEARQKREAIGRIFGERAAIASSTRWRAPTPFTPSPTELRDIVSTWMQRASVEKST